MHTQPTFTRRLLDLPPELRYTIYRFYFTNRIFTNDKLVARSWLCDIFLVCKSVSRDPWLRLAMLRHATFHVTGQKTLEDLQRQFGRGRDHEGGLLDLSHLSNIRFDASLLTERVLTDIHTTLPGLRAVRLMGWLWPMYHIWDQDLAGFDRSRASRLVADLCVFGRYGIFAPCPLVVRDLLLGKGVNVHVDFQWDDPGFGKRRMTFSLQDFTVRYEYNGRRFEILQD